VQTRNLGGLTVSALGFGTMSFASFYGQSPDKAEAIRVIRGAHEQGVTLFDTAEPMVPLPTRCWSVRRSPRSAARW
jgi:aryl-alcohol dehydrogenase-like predicted oxidoreductase